jgi:hypothetical protein
MNTNELLKIIQEAYKFLFTKYKFRIAFKSERQHPFQIRVGLESDFQRIKLLFIHEWGTSLFIGTLDKSFTDEDEWFNCERLVDFILKRPLRWPPLKLNKPYFTYLVEDITHNGQEFASLIDQIISMFIDESAIEQWRPNFENYVRQEIQRKYKPSKLG